jgi:hypothetical protein
MGGNPKSVVYIIYTWTERVNVVGPDFLDFEKRPEEQGEFLNSPRSIRVTLMLLRT